MSKLVKQVASIQTYVQLWFTDDESLGTFQYLECEEHGTSLCFTDKSGADNCIECIKDMFETKTEYQIPGFENLEESLAKLTIRRTK